LQNKTLEYKFAISISEAKKEFQYAHVIPLGNIIYQIGLDFASRQEDKTKEGNS